MAGVRGVHRREEGLGCAFHGPTEAEVGADEIVVGAPQGDVGAHL